MILFLRSSDIGIDARLRRYARALRDAGIAHAALFWDRDGQALGDPMIAEIRYRASGAHGSRMRMALRLVGLNLCAFIHILRHRKAIRLVHAVDFDTALAALLANLIVGTPFIYDVYDHYPDSRGITGWARAPLAWLERCIFARAALVILADPARRAQHDAIPDNKYLVVENVPDGVAPVVNSATPTDFSLPLRIGYLGTLEPRFRGIEDVIAVVEATGNTELHVAGTGVLEPLVAARAAACERIHFSGPVPHVEGLAMLADCHIVLGLYYDNVPNHRYAAPNKYYEHLLLGRAMLTSAHTPPGRKVTENNTGWAVADGVNAIAAAVENMLADPAQLRSKGERAAALWQGQFADYFDRAIAGDYVAAVNRLALPLREVANRASAPAAGNG